MTFDTVHCDYDITVRTSKHAVKMFRGLDAVPLHVFETLSHSVVSIRGYI